MELLHEGRPIEVLHVRIAAACLGAVIQARLLVIDASLAAADCSQDPDEWLRQGALRRELDADVVALRRALRIVRGVEEVL